MEDSLPILKSDYYFEDTVSFVQSHLNVSFLNTCGRTRRARCPVHCGRKPTFYMYVSHGVIRFKCHHNKCNGNWDIFGLIQEVRGVEFLEAVKAFGQHLRLKKILMPRGNILVI